MGSALVTPAQRESCSGIKGNSQVKRRVVDDGLRAVDELQQTIATSRNFGLSASFASVMPCTAAAPASISRSGFRYSSRGIPTGGAAVHHLDAADLDDAMAQVRFEACGFRVEYDLSHGLRDLSGTFNRLAALMSLRSSVMNLSAPASSAVAR